MRKKIPTDEEFQSYKGAHCFNIWEKVGKDWICPGCNRNKREIMRWTKRYPRPYDGIFEAYKDWMAGLHLHHDHSAPYLSGEGRFPDTIICDQCNAADGVAKRKLCLPEEFSFSPSEINEFIIANPHESHKIDLEKAQAIYERITRDMY